MDKKVFEEALKRSFLAQAKMILEALDELVDDMGLRDEVFMVNCVAVNTGEDEEGTNISAVFQIQVDEAEDIADIMEMAMEHYSRYEKLPKNKLSATGAIFASNPISLN